MTKLRVLFAMAALAAAQAAAGADTAAAGVVGAASSTLVPLKGTVTAPAESVAFTGSARISSRLAKDPDFGSPHLLVTVDLTGVAGTGSSSRAKYVISGPELVQRRVAAAQRIDITFPFARSDSAGAPQSGVASFVLDVDTATGAVKSASGGIATPSFPR